MSSELYHHHGPAWHPHLPDWHPAWELVHELFSSSLHWPRQVSFTKPGSGEQFVLHACLVFCNMVWSSLHILMSIPLRKGANPLVLSLCREVIGFLALALLAGYLDRGVRPPLTRRILGLFFITGLMSALIRVTILQALEFAGPNVTAAIVPATPVITLAAGVMAGYETLHVHATSGEMQLFGLALCSISATQMALWKGLKLFGEPPSGSHAPTNIPLGASFMLFNVVISSITTILNKKLLGEWPLLSITACVEFFAVCWLSLIAGLNAPSSAWWIDTSVVTASLFGGLLATGANSIFLARANKRLGPLVSSMYVPVQPLTTAILDYLFLGDAFYISGLLGATGIVGGLFLVKAGKVQALKEIGNRRLSQMTSGGDESVRGRTSVATAPDEAPAAEMCAIENGHGEQAVRADEEAVALLTADGQGVPLRRRT